MNYILKKYECFNAVDGPNVYLSVTNNSSLYYIKRKDGPYVAWEKDDLTILPSNNKVIYNRIYYDVIGGKEVLNLIQDLHFNDDIGIMRDDIIPLSRVLGIKNGDKRFLSLDDISSLLSFEKNQVVKKKTLKEGKSIF